MKVMSIETYNPYNVHDVHDCSRHFTLDSNYGKVYVTQIFIPCCIHEINHSLMSRASQPNIQQ